MASTAHELSNWVGRSALVTLLAYFCAFSSGCAPSADGPTNASSNVAAGTEKLEFSIEGMTCNGCASSVLAALEAVPGVKSAEVSLEAKKAIVVADVAHVSAAKIEKAVEDAGYKARSIPASAPVK